MSAVDRGERGPKGDHGQEGDRGRDGRDGAVGAQGTPGAKLPLILALSLATLMALVLLFTAINTLNTRRLAEQNQEFGVSLRDSSVAGCDRQNIVRSNIRFLLQLELLDNPQKEPQVHRRLNRSREVDCEAKYPTDS